MWLLWTTSQSSLGLTRYYHNNNNASKCEAALRPTLLLEALHKNTCDNRCCCCDNRELDPNMASMDHIPIILGSNSQETQQTTHAQGRGPALYASRPTLLLIVPYCTNVLRATISCCVLASLNYYQAQIVCGQI